MSRAGASGGRGGGSPLHLLFMGWVAWAVLAGCGSGEEAALRIALPGQPANLDPNKTSDAISGILLNQLHEGLTRHSQALEVEPALAESWEFSPDFMQITFHLRPGLRWSDGQPLTAHDFVYSWRRLLAPETAAEYAYFLYDIQGAEDYNSGEAGVEALGVEALDDRMLRVKLTRPAAFFPHVTTFIVTHPVRRDVIERWGDAWTRPEHAVYTGPYVAAEWIDEYRMTLAPNPHHALQRPQIPRVEVYTLSEKTTALNLFVTERADVVIDMLPLAIPAFKGQPTYINAPKLEVRYVALRVDAPPTDDVRVRRALALAIRREEFPAILQGGELPTATWLPQGMQGHNPAIGLPQDPEAARKLLAEAGYPGGAGFPKLTLLFRAGDDWRLVAENLQQQWRRELGVEVQIQTREQKVFFEEIRATNDQAPPMHLARWVADFPDPENFMSLFIQASGNNNVRFRNARYDEAVDQAVRRADPAERKALYDEAQRLLVTEEVAIIPIYTGAQNLLIQPRVQGLRFNAMGDTELEAARWRDAP